MPFSFHSHSGQFCGHGQNKLEEVLKTAIAKKMDTYAMTEHMPRGERDLYPEEIRIGETPETLNALFKAYYHEANRLREAYAGQIQVLVGTEIDWIRPSSGDDIKSLLQTYGFDIFIGSVHHVNGIPTDYSRELYLEARAISGGTDERLFEDYFDLQLEMLNSLKPPIVGHFDVIRLLSDEPDASFKKWPGVWQRILRNLAVIVEYGGVLEINSAALRKGMSEPYPKGEICEEFLRRNGSFTLSDDAHSIAQVATHYKQALEFVEKTDISTITYFQRASSAATTGDSRFLAVSKAHVSLAGLKSHPFFS